MAKNERLKTVVEEIKFRFRLKTQKDICSKLGYTSSTYLSDMISGKTPLSDNFLERLRDIFGVDTDYLTGEGKTIFTNEGTDNSNNKIKENSTHQQDASSSALNKALDELSELRKLLAESIRNNKEQADRFFTILEKMK